MSKHARVKRILHNFDQHNWSHAENLPDKVLSTRRMVANLNGWDLDDVESVNAQTRLYTDFPLLCRGARCEFASGCPLVQNASVDRWAEKREADGTLLQVGLPCPVEIVEAFRLFAGYVNDLELKPDEFGELQLVANLVRAQLECRRLEQITRREPMLETVTITKSRVEQETLQPHRGLGMIVSLRAQIERFYKTLTVSRERKLAALAKAQSAQDPSTMFSDILARYESLQADVHTPQGVEGGDMY